MTELKWMSHCFVPPKNHQKRSSCLTSQPKTSKLSLACRKAASFSGSISLYAFLKHQKTCFLQPWIGTCSHRCHKSTNFSSFVGLFGLVWFFVLAKTFQMWNATVWVKVHTAPMREKNTFFECCWIVSLILKCSERFTFFFWAGTALQSKNAGPLLLCCHVKKKKKKKVFFILTTSWLFTLQL